MQAKDLKVGKSYEMTSSKGVLKVRLKEVLSYPATGMPDDFKFELISGDRTLVEASGFKSENCFPLPGGLIHLIPMKDVD